MSAVPLELSPAAEPPLILIADDSPTVRKILEITLRRAGYPVRSFADGFSMLQWLQIASSPFPRLIFLDIAMPRMDGYQVARYLRQRQAFVHTALVIHARRYGPLDWLKARLIGVQAYIAKPSTTQTILAVAAHYCS
ncbi:response regulator [Ktedonosporobacter rubrisoli]|uniref:Response regulator n=1 Tax=Ktedonosporobacter rubrisoli TaxID=2509675 RepID=A0A4P6JMX4_KTERU|nr:response regulator [Ktedonosporobacter rubrisoli]QBD76420.1 response regulator [Ktedonosporobacter rubrisoli]